MKFSIWYNEQESFFDLLEKYKNYISSVYFAAPSFITASWRSIIQNNNYEEQIKKLIKICNEYNIWTILTLNATCEHDKTWDKEHMLELINYIKKLKIFWLDSISLTNLLYVRFIKKSIPDLKIYSSVNCYVKNVEQALYMKKIWIDIITIDRDINRDLKLIKKIKEKTWLPIQVILNEWCIKNCPFRNTHFNIIAHWIEDNLKNEKNWKYNLIERFSCTPLLSENKKLIFRIPFIRPEDLGYYNPICDYFKLVTRWLDTEKIELYLKAYTDWFYHWNLFDIIDMSIIDYQLIINYVDNDKLTKLNFFQDIQKCPGDCDLCFNCDKYL
jgi:collagenase-like PrtC family protease